jgi:hypothetical protein
VALLDLANLLTVENHTGLFPRIGVATIIMQAFVPVSLLYFVGFLAYFWISRVSYLRRMQLAAA